MVRRAVVPVHIGRAPRHGQALEQAGIHLDDGAHGAVVVLLGTDGIEELPRLGERLVQHEDLRLHPALAQRTIEDQAKLVPAEHQGQVGKLVLSVAAGLGEGEQRVVEIEGHVPARRQASAQGLQAIAAGLAQRPVVDHRTQAQAAAGHHILQGRKADIAHLDRGGVHRPQQAAAGVVARQGQGDVRRGLEAGHARIARGRHAEQVPGKHRRIAGRGRGRPAAAVEVERQGIVDHRHGDEGVGVGQPRIAGILVAAASPAPQPGGGLLPLQPKLDGQLLPRFGGEAEGGHVDLEVDRPPPAQEPARHEQVPVDPAHQPGVVVLLVVDQGDLARRRIDPEGRALLQQEARRHVAHRIDGDADGQLPRQFPHRDQHVVIEFIEIDRVRDLPAVQHQVGHQDVQAGTVRRSGAGGRRGAR